MQTPFALGIWTLLSTACMASLQAQVLTPKAACELAHEEAPPLGRVFSIVGVYQDVFEHTAMLEPKACDQSFYARLEGEAAAKRDQFQDSFESKCGGPLRGDDISGVFTGSFVRDKEAHRTSWNGQTVAVRYDRFIVTNIDTQDLDPSSITCPR